MSVETNTINCSVAVPNAKELFVLFTRAQKSRSLCPYRLVAKLIQSLNYATNRNETDHYTK